MKSAAQAKRSTDPRRYTPQFQAYQENWAVRALDNMRLQPQTKAISQPVGICNDYLSETISDGRRHMHLRPPTPPRPSQKRLDEEGDSHWDRDGNSIQIPPTTTNDADWDEDGIDEGAGDGTSDYKIRTEKGTAREGSQVDDGGLEKGMADDCIKGEDSPRSSRLYTQEELAILTRKIFGDEDDEVDGAFWDADGAPWAAIDRPAKDEGASVDHQDQESDTGGQSGESEGQANEESKVDRLFGPTSNACLLTSSKDGLPCPHQDEDDDQNVEVTQEILEAAAVASSATVDTSDGVNSSNDDTPPTTNTNTTTSTPLISPESLCTALRPSPPTQRPPQSENGFGNLSTNDPQPGESSEGHAGVNFNLSNPVPVPTTQVEELEPRKLAVVIPGEEEPHCNTTRRIIRKKGLPEFSPTRPGIFSALIVRSSDDASLGKRKRSWEDDGDGGEEAFSLASVPQRDHQCLRPR